MPEFGGHFDWGRLQPAVSQMGATIISRGKKYDYAISLKLTLRLQQESTDGFMPVNIVVVYALGENDLETFTSSQITAFTLKEREHFDRLIFGIRCIKI